MSEDTSQPIPRYTVNTGGGGQDEWCRWADVEPVIQQLTEERDRLRQAHEALIGRLEDSKSSEIKDLRAFP